MRALTALQTPLLGLSIVVLALAVAVGGTRQAQAQDGYEAQTLEAFAASMVQVQEIRDSYLPQIEAASDRESAQQLQNEANTMMVQAIRDAGLDVQTYNEISQAMQQDSELRAKVMELVEEMSS